MVDMERIHWIQAYILKLDLWHLVMIPVSVILHLILIYPYALLLFNPMYTWIGLPWWYSSKESSCQFRRHKRHGFDYWLGKFPRRRKWQPTPVFLPGKSHEQRTLAGCRPWGHKDLMIKQQQWSGVERYNFDRRPRLHPFCFSAELNISASQWARQVLQSVPETPVLWDRTRPSWIERTANLLTQPPHLVEGQQWWEGW